MPRQLPNLVSIHTLTLLNIASTLRLRQSKLCSISLTKHLALWWHPVLRLPWLDVHDVHSVNLFQAATLRLADEEVDDDGAD